MNIQICKKNNGWNYFVKQNYLGRCTTSKGANIYVKLQGSKLKRVDGVDFIYKIGTWKILLEKTSTVWQNQKKKSNQYYKAQHQIDGFNA